MALRLFAVRALRTPPKAVWFIRYWKLLVGPFFVETAAKKEAARVLGKSWRKKATIRRYIYDA